MTQAASWFDSPYCNEVPRGNGGGGGYPADDAPDPSDFYDEPDEKCDSCNEDEHESCEIPVRTHMDTGLKLVDVCCCGIPSYQERHRYDY